MTDYVAYFLNSRSSVVQLETLEISHPDFTQSYFIVRNSRAGLTATLETAVEQVFDYYPLRIRPAGSKDDMEQSLQIDLGDLGEVLPLEVDAVTAAGGLAIKPIVKYRVYRSDDLSAPMLGPLTLEITNLASAKEGASFEASAPSLDNNRTGELYRLERFPMLRATL